jgi:hypothetical protein
MRLFKYMQTDIASWEHCALGGALADGRSGLAGDGIYGLAVS